MTEHRAMEFCPKCGSRLEPRKGKAGKEAALVLACPKCGYRKREPSKKIEPKVAKVIQHNPQQLVAVIGKEEQKLRTLPTVRVECPKCGNNLAYVWQVQTRGADESSTQFLRCTKCNHTFREYS
ncbi:MAG: transcription factor S [Candidatus Bathycorpusculaceae bacterium]